MPSSEPLPDGDVQEVATGAGPARVLTLAPSGDGPALAGDRRGVLALGHGAGGGIGSADLVAVAAASAALGWRVLLVEQPWRVAGRKVASPPAHLDRCWLEVLEAVLPQVAGDRLVVGGRSAGARVACRTATRLGADGVLALAFPLHPPGRPEKSRGAELAGCGVPALVVQGERDPFGGPDEVRAALGGPTSSTEAGAGAAAIRVVAVAGTHALSTDLAAVAAAATSWLSGG